MENVDVVRAWKDEEYRNSLSAEQLAALPGNPAGLVELDNQVLEEATGGFTGLECWIATIGITIAFCSPNGSLCGSCNWGTHACC